MQDIEIKEFEWYLRDHLFRQSNQGRQQFKKESLADEMIGLYLRYRNSTSQHMNDMVNAVVEKLISCQVLKKLENSLDLTSRLSRLQCSKCFYISYLSSSNEPRNCLRCLSNELHDFPKKNNNVIRIQKNILF
ncbi:MAG: hypothetical protein M3224_02275 [Thermoproteota archaeon]|nr:hypothetical protein [Thermoproteota archaeon]